MKETPSPYEDIISLPHHVSSRHPHMPLGDRAAQFAPFAALTGLDETVEETARLTEARPELDESLRELLDRRLRLLCAALPERPPVRLVFFRPDEKKAGGQRVSLSGRLKKLDGEAGKLCLTDGTAVPLDALLDIDSPLFRLEPPDIPSFSGSACAGGESMVEWERDE